MPEKSTKLPTKKVSKKVQKPLKKVSKVSKKVPQKKASGKPLLLSGDNPQIPKGEGDGPIQAYLSAIPGWKQDVGILLDQLIVRAVPKVHKAVKWNSPFYGFEGEGWFVSFHCFTKYMKVTFFRGSSLKPAPPELSKYKEVRYFHIRENEELDEAQFIAWVKQASKLPGEKI